MRIWHQTNKERELKRMRAWQKNNKETYDQYRKDYGKRYRQENKQSCSVRDKAYYKANKEILGKKQYQRKKIRLKTDPEFKLKERIRDRIRAAIKGNYRCGSAVRLLGCTSAELKRHIETKFKPGMTWDNWSINGWHLDHIRPLSSFDLTDIEDLAKACHFTNLQPLWAKENLTKAAKIL